MQIIDLAPAYEDLYFLCLEDWSDEIKESGHHKALWYETMKKKGLKVKLAIDDYGMVAGMVQYLPIEHSFFEGENLYVVLCIWVHGHKQGRGNFQKQGFGKALLKAAEEDVRQIGYGGIAAWGMIIPVFMRASWFKKQGYRKADQQGLMQLVWKPFNEGLRPPRFLKSKKEPEKREGKVNIDIFINGWCPAINMSCERTLRAIQGMEDKISIRQYNTLDRSVLLEWGRSDVILIDGKELRTGPPPSYQKIRNKIERNVKHIK